MMIDGPLTDRTAAWECGRVGGQIADDDSSSHGRRLCVSLCVAVL